MNENNLTEYQQYLFDHMYSRLKNATVQTDPFEYIIVKDFLPDEEYQRSLDHKSYDRTDLSRAVAPLRHFFFDTFSNAKDPKVESFNLQLTEWNQGYSYRPHLDGGPRVFSMIIFQPEHDLHPWLGTALYRKVDNDFRLVSHGPYLPNVAMAFPCGFDHWHGNELQMEEHRRKAMLCFFYNQKLTEQHGWDMEGYVEYDE